MSDKPYRPALPLESALLRTMLTEEQIQTRIKELGAEISRDYADRELVLIGILRGAVLFLSDLSRAITVPHSFDFVGASSYHGGTASSGFIRITRDVEHELQDKHVLVCEDIYDSGRTLGTIIDLLRVHRPASIEVCTLLHKEVPKRHTEISIRYAGFQIPDEFVVGYGLDYREYLRNLPMIGVLKPEIYQA